MRSFWYTSITCLALLACILVVLPASAFTTDFPKSYRLWQGSAAMHEIGVYGYCGTDVEVDSPYGAAFDLYAMKNSGSPGSCPSNEYIMSHYDQYANSNGGIATLHLDEGLWCVVVYARYGSGTAYVTAESNCFPPGPGPGPSPQPPYPAPCSPYKTVDRSGYLYPGQAAVYGYYIPTDGRSQIEWTVTGSGTCGDTPIIVSSVNGQVFRGSSTAYPGCGSNFDVYVFKDCNPQRYRCNTNYYANGPNAYVSVSNPSRDSTYYVMVYARSGSGTYNLRMNSYKCYGDSPVIVASAPIVASSYGYGATGSGTTSTDTAMSNSVSAPSAEFVSVPTQ